MGQRQRAYEHIRSEHAELSAWDLGEGQPLSSSGGALATPTLPELVNLVTINASEICSPSRKSIYSLSSGALLFGKGALAENGSFAAYPDIVGSGAVFASPGSPRRAHRTLAILQCGGRGGAPARIRRARCSERSSTKATSPERQCWATAQYSAAGSGRVGGVCRVSSTAPARSSA